MAGCCHTDYGTYDVESCEQCRRRGAYEKVTCAEGTPCGTCFLIKGLTNYLSEKAGSDDIVTFSTWNSIDLLYDFRDEVLKQCETGRHVLELYDRYADRAGAIINKDAKLLFETLRLLLLGILFARRLIVVKAGHKSRLSTDKPLDRYVLDRAIALLGQVRERTSNHELDEPIDFAEAMLTRIRDLKPAEVWALLQKPPEIASSRREHP